MKDIINLQKTFMDLYGFTSCMSPAVVLTSVLFIFSSCWITCAVDNFENVYGICEQSKFTIKEVSNCPKNYSEWKQRAQKLQCHTVQQTCTSRERFVYHCLPNSYWNRTLELCAPRKQINLQYCPEYNEKGMRVQENYAHSCSSGVVSCPISYTSDKAYKYQLCYADIKPNIQKRIRDQITKPNDDGFRSSAYGMKEARSSTAYALMLIVIVTSLTCA